MADLTQELAGQTALITGSARRVGRAIALELARAGAEVLIHYNTSRRESDELAAQILTGGGRAHTIHGNLERPEAITAMAMELDRHEMPVDILVNSAAVYFPTPLEEVTAEVFDQVMNINLRAPFLLAQAFGLRMKARGHGRIVNIADCNVARVYRNFTPYLASKAGLVTMTQALALELAPQVTVNAVAPGTVLPPDDASAEFVEQALRRSPLERSGSPEDVAKMVKFLIINGDFITGTTINVDGGATIR